MGKVKVKVAGRLEGARVMRKAGTYGIGRCYQPKYKNSDGKWVKSPRWMIDYYRDGERHREKTGTTSYKEAIGILKDRQAGKAPLPADLVDSPSSIVSIEVLFKLLETDYKT